MPGAIIAIDQVQPPGGPSYGSPGVARKDLWLAQTATARCTTAGNASFAWTLLAAPPGSATTLLTPTLAQTDWVPDLPGTYRLQLVTNGGGPGNIQILVAAVRYDTFGNLIRRGWLLPAFGEQSNEDNFAGNTRGYAPDFEAIIDDLLAGGISNRCLTPALGDSPFTVPSGLGTVDVFAPGGGPFTILQSQNPAPGDGINVWTWSDALLNSVTVGPNGVAPLNTNGAPAPTVLTTPWTKTEFRFNGTEWRTPL